MNRIPAWALVGLVTCIGFTSVQATDAARIIAADREPEQWLSHGRSYDEQRFSPLDAINQRTVPQLGLAWHFGTGDNRGMEATPIVADGVMYVSTTWSRVVALDAASGRLLWQFDPQVPGAKARDACCDVVNRGVALWGDKIFVGALDGRLIAIDAKSGAQVWSVQTTDTAKPCNRQCMLLRNHGTLAVGATCADAFMAMYYLERACTMQIRALAGGAAITMPPQGEDR